MKKPDFFNKATSEKLEIDINIVKQVNRYYWKEVRRCLAKAEYTSVFIKNFGTIVVSPKKLRQEILFLVKKIRSVKNSERITEKKKGFILEVMYENLNQLLARHNELAKLFYKTPKHECTERISEVNPESPEESGESIRGLDQ